MCPQEEASVTPSDGCGGCCGLVWPKCPGPGARAVTKGLCFVPLLSAGLEGLIPCPGISLTPLAATGVQQAPFCRRSNPLCKSLVGKMSKNQM